MTATTRQTGRLNILATSLLTIAIFATSVAAQGPVPFVCSDIQGYVLHDVDTTIYEVSHDFTHIPVCPTLGIEVNNLSFRSLDGLLYGTQLTPTGFDQLVRIDANCNIEFLGDAGLPNDKRFDAGDLSADGRFMFVQVGGGTTLYKVDLETAPLSTIAVTIQWGGQNDFVHDWAYNPDDGLLYGAGRSGNRFVKLDPDTGKLVFVSLPGLPSFNDGDAIGAYGGAWFNASGTLFLHRNNGDVFEVDIDAPAIKAVHTGIFSDRNDASPCFEPPTPECGRFADYAFSLQDQNCRVFECDPSTPPFSCSRSCDPMDVEINNSGFRRTDGKLYGVELTPSGNSGIVRVDPGGCDLESLETVGLPTGQRFDAGDVSTDGRWMYIYINNSPLYIVDLTTAPPLQAVAVPILRHPAARNDSYWTGSVHDWAYNPDDGLLYGGDDTDGQLAVLDPRTGRRLDYAVPYLPRGEAFGGAWINSDGYLVLHRNNGEAWEVDLATKTVHWPVWPLRASDRNDSAICVP